jgi:hypothetical protein
MPDAPEADGLDEDADEVAVLDAAAVDEDEVEEPPPQAARSRAAATSEVASQARGWLIRAVGMSCRRSFGMRG